MSFEFSVVTASYSQLDHLRRCSLSIQDQGNSAYVEHLVQEGKGGADFDAWSSAQQFSDVVTEPDSGMYDAINKGFERSSGRYLSWLNCDEQYLPNTLSIVSRWFNENPDCDLLFGDTLLISEAGELVSYRKAMIPYIGQIRHLFLPTYSASTFVRRRVLDEGHSLDQRFKMIADAVWIAELLSKGYKGGTINQPLSTFLQTGTNLGQTSDGVLEGQRWRRHHTFKGRFYRDCWKGIHRLRKWYHGSYQSFSVNTAIYQGEDLKRRPISGKVGGVWRMR